MCFESADIEIFGLDVCIQNYGVWYGPQNNAIRTLASEGSFGRIVSRRLAHLVNKHSASYCILIKRNLYLDLSLLEYIVEVQRGKLVQLLLADSRSVV